jgi:hypothetical protein
MKKEVFDGSVETVGGKKLPEPLKFKVECDTFVSYDEMVAAGQDLKPKERLKARNTQIRNKARGAAQDAALEAAGIEKPDMKNSEDVRIANMAKSFVAKGMALDKALAKAARIMAELDAEMAEESEDDDN